MYRILVAFIGALICCQSFASKEQTDAYIAALSHPYKEVSHLAASDIYYIPLGSDPRLYEYIAAEVQRLHRAVGLTSEDKDKYALLEKALAASGDPQYDDLLQEVKKSSNRKVGKGSRNKKVIKRAIELSDRFNRWQKVVSQVDFDGVNQDAEIGRVFIETLKSPDVADDVKTYIFQTLFAYGYLDCPELYDYLRADLLKQIEQVNRRVVPKETLGWQGKALMSGGRMEDIEVLIKLRKTAKKMRSFNGFHFKDAEEIVTRFHEANQNILQVKLEYPELSGLVQRYLGLLHSKSAQVRVFGMREAFTKHRFEAPLYDKIFSDLEATWQIENLFKMKNQHQAWACKYLAASGREDAMELLSQIAQSSPNSYVKKHASAQLEIYSAL